jgi:UDP-glucose 4-epimerase
MGLNVAVTGGDTFFGRDLIAALDADPDVSRVVSLDVRPPSSELWKTSWQRVDLVHPRSAELLARLLKDEAVDVVVHTAFLARPVHRGGWAHELEAIGTRHLLAAVEAAGVRRVVMRSSTLTYGALATHPGRIPETATMAGAGQSRFLADKIEAENQLTRFAQRHPQRTVTILRLAPLLGPRSDTLATLYLSRRVCPMLLGHDPLVQLLHESDAIEAVRRAVHRGLRGAVNVAAPGVLPLSRAVELCGAKTVSLPASLLRRLSETLWLAQVGDFPPGLLDFLRYSVIGDLSRMKGELGFEPSYDVRGSLLAFASALQTGRHPAVDGGGR